MPYADYDNIHAEPAVRAELAHDASLQAEDEVYNLEALTNAQCSVTPRLFFALKEEQDNSMWIPGGYIYYTLMEKLPGQPPLDFWEWPREKRDEVRKAFTKSIR